MTIADVVSRLNNPKRTANGFTALCPAHDDRSPSLSVREGDHRIVMKCFAGCSENDILGKIGLEKADLFPERENTPVVRIRNNCSQTESKVAGIPKTIEAVYSYLDADGELLYENVRFAPKAFRQRRPDGNGGYLYNLDGINRVPYSLPELIAAMKTPVAEIWFAEGEKDADNLRLLGFTATSFKNWNQNHNQYINGSHAVLFADHDKAGLRQADDAAMTISAVAASVKVIDLFGGETLLGMAGQDVTDWIDDRRDEGLDDETIAERLSILVEGSTVWQHEKEAKTSGLEIEFLNTVTAREISWLAKPLIPFGFFTLLDGIEGIGKTYAMLDIAKRLTLGEPMPFNEEKQEPGNVLFLSVEDSPEYVLKPRFERMKGDCSRLAVLRGHFDFSDAGIADLEQTIRTYDVTFVLIDPLFSFTGRADINSTADVRPITDRLNRLAAIYGIAIVGIRHINKTKGYGDPRNAGSHAVAWLQGCRSGLIVGHDAEDKARRGIGQHKLNIAAESNAVYGFEIDVEGNFAWTGESDLTISQMLAHKSNESNEERSALAEAMRFLKDQLANGGKFKTDLDAEARGEGISTASLNRAKAKLGIKPKKGGLNSGWRWELPEGAHRTVEGVQ